MQLEGKIQRALICPSPSCPTDHSLYDFRAVITTRKLALVQSTELFQISPASHALICVCRGRWGTYVYSFIRM